MLYQDIGRHIEAEKLFLRAEKIARANLGDDHPDYAQFINTLGGFYYTIGKYEKAAELFAKAISIEKDKLGENHPEYISSLNNFAGFYETTGQLNEALSFYHRALDKRLYQIKTYFPSMSEREKGEFLKTINENFERYYSFISSHLNLLPNITDQNVNVVFGNLYNYRLATKALLFNSTNKIRNNILSSGDSVLIKKI